MKKIKRGVFFTKDTLIAIMAVVTLIIVIFPIPSLMLDILIALNLVFALVIFITVLYSKKADAFSDRLNIYNNWYERKFKINANNANSAN
jgi:type III secretory pathway component EscV